MLILSYLFRFYLVGAPAPIQSYTAPSSAVVCGQVAGSTVTNNPSGAAWDDPNQAGAACVWMDTGSGPLFSLPVGSYEGTVAPTTSAGTGVESNRAPFSVGVAAKLSNFRFIK